MKRSYDKKSNQQKKRNMKGQQKCTITREKICSMFPPIHPVESMIKIHERSSPRNELDWQGLEQAVAIAVT